jgi:hypothetical protein
MVFNAEEQKNVFGVWILKGTIARTKDVEKRETQRGKSRNERKEV